MFSKKFFLIIGLLLSRGLISNFSLYELEKSFFASVQQILENSQSNSKEIFVISYEEETSFERRCKCCIDEVSVSLDQLAVNVNNQGSELQKFKKNCSAIDLYVKKSNHFSRFFKLFVHAFCLHSKEFFDGLSDLGASQELCDSRFENPSSDKDVFEKCTLMYYEKTQIFLEHMLYAYEKLKKNLAFKKMIVPFNVLQDVKFFHKSQFFGCCEELLRIIHALHVTEPVEKAFQDLIFAMQKGFEDLQYGARHYITYKIEHFLDDPVVEIKMKALKILIQQRKDLLLSAVLDDLDVEIYEKTLNVFLGKIKKSLLQKQSKDQSLWDVNMISGTEALEQIIFKN